MHFRAFVQLVTRCGKAQGEATALNVAAARGHAEVVALLLDSGAQTETKDGVGLATAHGCLARSRRERGQHAKFTARHCWALKGCRFPLIPAVQQNGYTALGAASLSGHTEVIRLLLGRGACTETRNRVSPCPANKASGRLYASGSWILIANGYSKPFCSLCARFVQYGDTALVCAASGDYCSAVSALLDGGAQIEEANDVRRRRCAALHERVHDRSGCGRLEVWRCELGARRPAKKRLVARFGFGLIERIAA